MTKNILAVGDVVGTAGLRYLSKNLRRIRGELSVDFAIVNGENASMSGVTPQQADEIFDAGADVITLGNHTFGRDQIASYLDDCPFILRPANLAPQCPGRGYGIFDSSFGNICVINMIGRCGMNFGPDNPFLEIERILKKVETPLIFMDFHAEATSEKGAMAHMLDGRITALWGTHTHVQTSDARVLAGGTGYLTDVGMTGPAEGIIGVDPRQSISMFCGNPPQRYKEAVGPCSLECVLFTVDTSSGHCLNAEAFRF